MANIKIERLNHAFQQEISMIIMREVKNENIKLVTITGVETTNDLSFSKVYYTIFDETKKDVVKEALEKAAPFIRSKLWERVDIRHTPELKFVYDDSIAYGAHIEKVIEQINEKDKKQNAE